MKKGTIRLMVVLLMAVMASATMKAADWGFYDLKGKVKRVTETVVDSRYGFGNYESCRLGIL